METEAMTETATPKQMHRGVTLTNHVGSETSAVVMAKPGAHPFLIVEAGGLGVTIHMRPEDAIAFGRALIEVGEYAQSAPLAVKSLEVA